MQETHVARTIFQRDRIRRDRAPRICSCAPFLSQVVGRRHVGQIRRAIARHLGRHPRRRPSRELPGARRVRIAHNGPELPLGLLPQPQPRGNQPRCTHPASRLARPGCLPGRVPGHRSSARTLRGRAGVCREPSQPIRSGPLVVLLLRAAVGDSRYAERANGFHRAPCGAETPQPRHPRTPRQGHSRVRRLRCAWHLHL